MKIWLTLSRHLPRNLPQSPELGIHKPSGMLTTPVSVYRALTGSSNHP